MRSQALNEIRRLRRDRYGQASRSGNSLNLQRRTLYPSSLESNVPRQRYRRNTSTTPYNRAESKSIDSSTDEERHGAMTNSLLQTDYVRMKASGAIPSIQRDFSKDRQLKPRGFKLLEGEYDDDDEEDEECDCFPGKDLKSKERREFWRRRLRDAYVFLFVFMFLAAFVAFSSKETSDDPESLKIIHDIDIEMNENEIKKAKKMVIKKLRLLEQLQDLTVPYNKSLETPLFFDIHLTGSSIVKDSLSKCHQLALASEFGLQQPNFEEDTLGSFVSYQRKANFNATYVNVDTSTSSGLQRAAKLDLIPSRMADVVTMSSLYDSNIIFHPNDYPGRMFAIFVHPTARAIGYYHYIKKATWDERFNVDVKEMTLMEFSSSKYMETNPMVRLLTQSKGVDPTRKLTMQDLEVAKKVLERKCLIGLYRDLVGSLARFDRYFGWTKSGVIKSKDHDKDQEKLSSNVKTCRKDLVKNKDWWLSRQERKIAGNSTEMGLLEEANMLDLRLYSHIERIYKAQGDKIFHVV